MNSEYDSDDGDDDDDNHNDYDKFLEQEINFQIKKFDQELLRQPHCNIRPFTIQPDTVRWKTQSDIGLVDPAMS